MKRILFLKTKTFEIEILRLKHENNIYWTQLFGLKYK